jgi:hypothetical protein
VIVALPLIVFAVAAASPLPVETQAQPAGCIIAAGTMLIVETGAPLNSKTSRTGDLFPIRLAAPLADAATVSLPAGTPGIGQVVHAAKARALGKGGEMLVVARHLEIGGVRIPLRSFRLGKRGNSNADEAMVATMLGALPVAAFIVGGEVNFPAGTAAQAIVAAETRLPFACGQQPDPVSNEGE